jgi:hypothetical protein
MKNAIVDFDLVICTKASKDAIHLIREDLDLNYIKFS